jgi:hypothetical protein
VAQTEVQKYIEALRSHEINIRRDAARALGEIGPGAKDAVPELVKALEDDDMDLIAVWTLGRIGPTAIAAAPAIKRWLKKLNSSCRCLGNIRSQLLYLPEDKRGRPETKITYKESQLQESKHG